jgi:hypothetical protein
MFFCLLFPEVVSVIEMREREASWCTELPLIRVAAI